MIYTITSQQFIICISMIAILALGFLINTMIALYLSHRLRSAERYIFTLDSTKEYKEFKKYF